MPKLRGFKTADLVSWRKRQLLRRALADAGDFGKMLDLPCGDGRHWSVFRDMGVASLVAAEVSKGVHRRRKRGINRFGWWSGLKFIKPVAGGLNPTGGGAV